METSDDTESKGRQLLNAPGTEQSSVPLQPSKSGEPSQGGVNPAGKDWVHMEQTEPEKTSWTGELPPPPKPGDTKVSF